MATEARVDGIVGVAVEEGGALLSQWQMERDEALLRVCLLSL